MAAFLFCASHWTLVDSMCACCKSASTATTSRLRDVRKYIQSKLYDDVENRRDGREPRRGEEEEKQFPDNWRLQRDSRLVVEEVFRLENLGYFRREREREETAISSKGFSETNGSCYRHRRLCLFLDPREIRVPLSNRFDEPLPIVSVRTRVEWQLNDPYVLLVTINEYSMNTIIDFLIHREPLELDIYRVN